MLNQPDISKCKYAPKAPVVREMFSPLKGIMWTGLCEVFDRGNMWYVTKCICILLTKKIILGSTTF